MATTARYCKATAVRQAWAVNGTVAFPVLQRIQSMRTHLRQLLEKNLKEPGDTEWIMKLVDQVSVKRLHLWQRLEMHLKRPGDAEWIMELVDLMHALQGGRA